MSEPKPCPDCRGVAGNDCAVCDGVGFEPYAPPRRPLPDGRLFDPAVIPDVDPPALPKK